MKKISKRTKNFLKSCLAFLLVFNKNKDDNTLTLMFTGIIQEEGKIEKIHEKNGIRTFLISASDIVKKLKIGDSISVDGTCLTVTKKTAQDFEVEAIPETIQKTISKNYREGSIVNLEPAMQMSDRFHGHFVSGHVDFVGKITRKKMDGDSLILSIEYPKNMGKYFSLKGSVTVNGVSLTVSKIEEGEFEISLIPHTLQNTNLQTLEKNGEVNIEIDVIARYLESLLNAKESESNYFFLKERGFI